MDVAALTMLVFGVVIVGSGLTGLLAPHILLSVLGITEGGHSTQLFVMATSQASLAMGLYYILAAVNETRSFFQWSVPLRIINFIVFTSMVAVGVAPRQWLMVAGLELTGAVATGIALASKKGFVIDRFNTLRITSVILALVGGILTIRPLGLYGSASAFMVIFTTGFIYTYRKFAPPRTGA